jgi:hypothetical protein
MGQERKGLTMKLNNEIHKEKILPTKEAASEIVYAIPNAAS